MEQSPYLQDSPRAASRLKKNKSAGIKLQELIAQYGCGKVRLAGTDDALYDRHLIFDNVVAASDVTLRERYEALARSLRDILSQRWILTEETYDRINPKRAYYLSLEFLIGRAVWNNISNLLLTELTTAFAGDKKLDLLELIEIEPDAGLGNGGLGRLAACFIESSATLELPVMGYGLRYEYGMFHQQIVDGWQVERPDDWLRRPDPWEVPRLSKQVEVKFNCSFRIVDGKLDIVDGVPSSLVGIPFDRPVVGYGGKTINTLRLWAAEAPQALDFQRFGQGDFVGALTDSLCAESLTKVLYPNDSTIFGRGLRFLQEYFLVACSLADIVRKFRQYNSDWEAFPEKVAVQMNDTHPALAVPELMRILLDDVHLEWDEAWRITRDSLAYTNHTLLPEALETWPRSILARILPRHLEIIFEINRRLMVQVQGTPFGTVESSSHISLVEEGAEQKIRMANLAIVGSHSTNGVAAIHSTILKSETVKDLAQIYPERFNNKTNGVTPRRWLLISNPYLSEAITEVLGDRWITDLMELKRLIPLADNRSFQGRFLEVKKQSKVAFSNWVKKNIGIPIDPESIFDSQVKRIHEYKRQMLNVLRIIVLCNRIKNEPKLEIQPQTFLFAGKAAPSYQLAKLIIKLINNLAGTIAGDSDLRDRIKVLFLPDYCVSLAERLIPASDVSNQISTAGFEASGTSNMKFMMNGALTIATRDGATIEMAESAGDDNLFLFGLNAEEVRQSRSWYSPYWHLEHEPETRAALDLIRSDHFSRNEPGVFHPLLDSLLTQGDRYMHLADLKSYLAAHGRLLDLYVDKKQWARKAILNIAHSGKFSSDRTISEYAKDIWGVKPCPVSCDAPDSNEFEGSEASL